ncbi:hypothetical protein D3C81_1023450 [compost metagenome]
MLLPSFTQRSDDFVGMAMPIVPFLLLPDPLPPSFPPLAQAARANTIASASKMAVTFFKTDSPYT